MTQPQLPPPSHSLASSSSPSTYQPVPHQPGLSMTKIIMIGVFGLMGLGMILAALTVSGVITSTASLFKINTTYKSAVASSIGELKREQKLVVLSVPVTVMMYRQAEKNLGGFLPLGTTEMMMVTDDNRVQYFVPLDQITENDFKFDVLKKTVTVRVPKPVVDEEMVSVQSDPSKIHVMTNTGWLRIDGTSVEFLKGVAQKEMRDTVIGEGNKPFLKEQAQAAAELNLRKLLTPLVRSLEDGVELKIEFKEK